MGEFICEWILFPATAAIAHIGRLLGEGLGVAGHGLAFTLVDVGEHALLVHRGELVFLGVALLLECLHRSLE